MANKQVRQSPDGIQWCRATEHPPDVFATLHKPNRAIEPVAIVATVDSDGRPRTAPFGSLRAVTPQLLRLAYGDYHDTYANLCRDGQVSVAVVAAPDIAVSIRDHARVVKAPIGIARHLVAIEVDIEEVRNDMMRRGTIEGTVGFTSPEDLKGSCVGATAEIEDM